MIKAGDQSLIRDEVLGMRGAIELYRRLAEDSFERGDFLELNSQASGLLGMLGEKNLIPEDLEGNSNGMKGFINSLKVLGGKKTGKGKVELNYYKSMFFSFKVSVELDYFVDSAGN